MASPVATLCIVHLCLCHRWGKPAGQDSPKDSPKSEQLVTRKCYLHINFSLKLIYIVSSILKF
jgi:hypothetical protein